MTLKPVRGASPKSRSTTSRNLTERAPRTSGSRSPKQLDEVDLELIAELAKDPRQTQTAMARMVGMTVDTVATRLRRLRDQNIIATTIVVDWQAAGYRAGAISRFRLNRPLSKEQVERIVETPGVHFLSLATGCCDIVVAVLGTDLIELRESLTSPSIRCPCSHGPRATFPIRLSTSMNLTAN